MYTEISIYKLRIVVCELRESEVNLKHKLAKLHEISSSLKYIELDAMDELRYKLKRQLIKLEHDIGKIQKLRMVLEQVIRAYGKCEAEIQEYEEVYYKIQPCIPILPHVLVGWNGAIEELQIQFK